MASLLLIIAHIVFVANHTVLNALLVSFPSILHNSDIQDMTAVLFLEVCYDISMSVPFNHFLVDLSPLPLLTQNLMHILTLKYLTFGVAGITPLC